MTSRRAHICAKAIAAFGLTAIASMAPLAAQSDELTIDRWLVTHTRPIGGGANPLETDGVLAFPDRDLTIGPGYWTLVREDGQASFSLEGYGERPPAATTTLAHAYIKAPYDLTAGLGVEGPGCSEVRAWLNGQPVFDLTGEAPVRLAAGWNSLLISLDGGGECAPRLSAALSSAEIPIRDDEDPADLGSFRLQASRPPGARRNHPDGVLLLESPTPTGLTWRGDEGQLLARMSYSVTAWGGLPGLGRPDGPLEDIPEGPPTVDLTGEWIITFYTPTGIQTSQSTFEMSDDGTLTGRLEGEGLEGDIQDGWVSGDEFGWRMRFRGRGRDLQLGVRGVLTDGSMAGSLDFGGFRDFEARFEGKRAPAEGSEDGEDGEADSRAEGGDEPPPEEDGARDLEETAPPVDPRSSVPDVPTPERADPQEGGELDAPADPDGLRARIVRQLLPPPQRPPAAAPTAASIELDISGGKLEGAFDGLQPLLPQSGTGDVQFRRARSAALDENGFEARLRWNDDSYDFVGRVSAAALLEVFHQPIALSGWGVAGDAGFSGNFRVPDALDGFTLRVGAGDWVLEGSPLAGDLLCQPCEGGQRFDLSVSGTRTPSVRVVEPGFPDGRASNEAPPATVWLDTLEGDGEQYRELGRRFGSSS